MINNKKRESIIKKRGYRYDIEGDRFSLYISSFPVAIKYLRERIGDRNKILAELCCGIGVTMEYIGPGFKKIIGIDNNRYILDQCKNNLKNTGLLNKSTLILGDVNDDKVLKSIRAEVVIYDIPYWYSHKSESKGDLIEKNPPLKYMIEKIRRYISKDIIIFCPPYYKHNDILKDIGTCEFQKVFINGKHDRNHVYLGDLIEKEGIGELKLGIKNKYITKSISAII